MTNNNRHKILVKVKDGTHMYLSEEEVNFIKNLHSIKGNKRAVDALINKAKYLFPEILDDSIKYFYPN